LVLWCAVELAWIVRCSWLFRLDLVCGFGSQWARWCGGRPSPCHHSGIRCDRRAGWCTAPSRSYPAPRPLAVDVMPWPRLASQARWCTASVLAQHLPTATSCLAPQSRGDRTAADGSLAVSALPRQHTLSPRSAMRASGTRSPARGAAPDPSRGLALRRVQPGVPAHHRSSPTPARPDLDTADIKGRSHAGLSVQL
jgi:hypothetical protein